MISDDVENFSATIAVNPHIVFHKNGFDKGTLLHLLFSLGVFNDAQKTMADSLIGAGAEVNAKNDQERTPLHYAAMSCSDYEAAMKYLVLKGANISAIDRYGKTPNNYASERK